MRVLVTGSAGFIGKNVVVRLGEVGGHQVLPFDRETPAGDLAGLVGRCDAIIHLAGVNRPQSVSEFAKGNRDFTARLCEVIAGTGRPIPLVVTSSIQADQANPYGTSKREAEEAVVRLADTTGNPVAIYRLPNVFGKWCRPNYNSVVATFCHNLANDVPIQINDPAALLSLVYVDDVVDEFIRVIGRLPPGISRCDVTPVYRTTVGDLAAQIRAFTDSRASLITERVGSGFVRALYATYVSYLPTAKFAYRLPRYGDERGAFVEVLKTKDSGQFSFFTAHPGITRGGHYHHSKSEKFLVIKGQACFGFRHLLTGERFQVYTDGGLPQVVETVPGWAHDITNVGDEEMLVLLWANEIFDRARPDTMAAEV